MIKHKVGIVGWRGMVGSVLIKRMTEEKDFENFSTFFFSTSQAGEDCPFRFSESNKLFDANNLDDLKKMNIIVTCQGSDFTEKVYQKLRDHSWQGHWIDAASYLRMNQDSVIILDPINRDLIDKKLETGNKTWVGRKLYRIPYAISHQRAY